LEDHHQHRQPLALALALAFALTIFFGKRRGMFFKLGRIPLALLFPAQYSCDTPPSPAITLPR